MTTKKAKDKHLEEVVEQVKKQEKKSKEDSVDYKEQALRAMADLQNVKRRSEIEKAEFAKFASAEILQKITPFLDDMHRAFSYLPDNIKSDSWVEGVSKIQTELWKTLEKEGFKKINPQKGEDFDINLHESLMQDPNQKAGKISNCLEIGYVYKDKVLRPAKVSVGV